MSNTIWLRSISVAISVFTLSSFNTAKALTYAAPIKLAWDASPGSVGYALYYRSVGSSVITRLDAGTAQAITVPNLEAGSNYVFFVVAYDGDGDESAPSNPIVYNPPALSPLRLQQLPDGTISVQFCAAAGSHCQVECTSSLRGSQWQTLGDATADANGNVVVNDPPVGRPAVRFYRGIQLIDPYQTLNAVSGSVVPNLRRLVF